MLTPQYNVYLLVCELHHSKYEVGIHDTCSVVLLYIPLAHLRHTYSEKSYWYSTPLSASTKKLIWSGNHTSQTGKQMLRPNPGAFISENRSILIHLSIYPSIHVSIYSQWWRPWIGLKCLKKICFPVWLVWLPDQISMQVPNHAEVLHNQETVTPNVADTSEQLGQWSYTVYPAHFWW